MLYLLSENSKLCSDPCVVKPSMLLVGECAGGMGEAWEESLVGEALRVPCVRPLGGGKLSHLLNTLMFFLLNAGEYLGKVLVLWFFHGGALRELCLLVLDSQESMLEMESAL